MRKKELIELSITVILVVVMIFALGNAAKSRFRNTKSVLPVVGSPIVASPAQAGKKTDNKDLYNFLEKQAELIELKRDPFTIAPITIEKGAQSGVVLTGILWDKDRPLAIIEGNVVGEGQRVGNKIVMKIKRDRVILSDGEALSEVKLQQ